MRRIEYYKFEGFILKKAYSENQLSDPDALEHAYRHMR